MGKVVLDFLTLHELKASQTTPVQLRLISQVVQYDEQTGYLTVTNIPNSQLANYGNKSHGNPENEKKTATSSSPSSSSSVMELRINLNQIIRNITYKTTPEQRQRYRVRKSLDPRMTNGTIVNVEIMFRGLSEDIVALDLYECLEPETVVKEMNEILKYQDLWS
ncbi:unnamed protein product [Ambrosiozyma monospora]|uniref:Unnamed protein product n=1 Tax=Ambrosiozyma monospora TaxID=43982 RepID=A0ACB5SW52_AMBMO|nr:unnamed protein product [Ambrosiozyma monospora]